MKTFVILMTLTAAPAFGFTCGTDEATAALEERLAPRYGDVVSTIDCDKPKGVETMICANPSLREIELLDTQAFIYSYENATKSEAIEAHEGKPFLDEDWARLTRDACTMEECLCTAFIAHINASMGGDNPYAGYAP